MTTSRALLALAAALLWTSCSAGQQHVSTERSPTEGTQQASTPETQTDDLAVQMPPQAPAGPLFHGQAADCRQLGYQVTSVTPRARTQDASVFNLTMATRGDRIALAWLPTHPREQERGPVYLALYDEQLALVDQARVELQQRPQGVALAATPDGWMLAAAHSSGLNVIPLSPELQSRPVRSHPGGYAVILAARPDGPPLLTYFRTQGERGQKALLLEADGSARWQVHLFDDVTEPTLGSALWTGQGFLVAQRSNGVTVVPLGLDGQVGEGHTDLGGSTEYPQLCQAQQGAVLTYTEFGHHPASLRWAALDHSGQRRAGPVRLGNIPFYFNRSPAVAVGDDTLVLLARHTGTTSHSDGIDLALIGPDGSARLEACSLLAEGETVVTEPRIARLDDGAFIIAWRQTAPQESLQLLRVELP